MQLLQERSIGFTKAYMCHLGVKVFSSTEFFFCHLETICQLFPLTVDSARLICDAHYVYADLQIPYSSFHLFSFTGLKFTKIEGN